jgi:hypothetical protein
MHCTRFGIPLLLITFLTSSASADQAILDDLIVMGSACVGWTCQLNEDFQFDTLRLKDDVIRLRFQDTSNTASFPTNDWQITINDDDTGTEDRFSIDDVDAGTTPFTLEAGAPTGSLYVASDGRVGIGTVSPSATAALDVRGSVVVDQVVELTGTTINDTGLKAGIVPANSFADGQASVTFTTPYSGSYTVLLTPVSVNPKKTFKPALLSQDASGFTFTAGKKSVTSLVEMHWMTQPVGE